MTPTERAIQYSKDIIAGKRVASKLVKLAAERHLRDLKEKKWNYNTERADACANWLEKYLIINDNPIKLLDWQNWVVTNWAGFEKPDGRRRFETVVMVTAKGSWKSTLMGGIALFQLVGDKWTRDKSPNIIVTANSSEQASIIVNFAIDFVRANPALAKRIDVRGGEQKPTSLYRTPQFRQKGLIHRFASDKSGGLGKGRGGFNPTSLIVDEAGEMDKETGTVAWLEKGRKQTQEFTMWMPSNPAPSRHDAELSPYVQRAVDMLYQIREDDNLLAFVAELDEDAPQTVAELIKPENEKFWAQANPGIEEGAPPRDYVFGQLQNSLTSPLLQMQTLRMNMGMWVDSRQSAAIITQNIFDTLVTEKLSADRQQHPCFIGIDLSNIYQAEGANDLLSIAQAWKLPGGRVEMEINSYIPNKNIDKREALDGRPWSVWAKDSTVHVVPDAWTQWDYIAEEIKKIVDANDEIVAMAVDTYNFRFLKDALKQIGITESRFAFLNHLQTAKPGVAGGKEKGDTLFMPQSIKHFLRLVTQERLKILKNPLNKIAFCSTETKPDNYGNTILVKGNRKDKNDPAVAGIMALGAAEEHKDTGSYAEYLEMLNAGTIPTSI